MSKFRETPVKIMDSSIEWLWKKLIKYDTSSWIVKQKIFNHAKEMEKKEILKRQLFIGKVSEIIGVEKTIELLREVNNEINKL